MPTVSQTLCQAQDTLDLHWIPLVGFGGREHQPHITQEETEAQTLAEGHSASSVRQDANSRAEEPQNHWSQPLHYPAPPKSNTRIHLSGASQNAPRCHAL